ncbi:MAG: lipoyl synthase [Chloroflexi bacterium]|nr:lipoyl synthase [Chloroflexota bacterium]
MAVRHAGSLPRGCDVAVVGAGIAGGAVAWGCARRGARVVVLERRVPAAGASGAAAGMLAPCSEAPGPGPFLDLARHSLGLWPALTAALLEEGRIDCELDTGGLRRRRAARRRQKRRRQRSGALCRSLDRRHRRRVRRLRPHHRAGARPAARAARPCAGTGTGALRRPPETVGRLYRQVRPRADLLQSLRLIQLARRLEPRSRTKSGLMLGLGESLDEVRELLTLMHAHDVEIVTIGQYLRLALVSRASPPGDHHDRVHASIVL